MLGSSVALAALNVGGVLCALLARRAGIIKTSPDGLLLQASTLSEQVPFHFSSEHGALPSAEPALIPGAYIEYVERRPLPAFAHKQVWCVHTVDAHLQSQLPATYDCMDRVHACIRARWQCSLVHCMHAHVSSLL